MEDTQIIALYLSRQEAAIGETAKKYGGYINRIAYNILRCREDTEEIAADTYLAAWNAIPPEIPRVLKHFLSRIARNLAFDRLDYITAKRRDVHSEIADKLGLTERNVKYRLSFLRQKLRKQLEREGINV